jgi:putative flippase GtrA
MRMKRKEGCRVSTIRRLYERFRHLIHEGAKFGVVGAIGFVVTDGGTNLLHGIGWLKATVVSTIAATVVTYLGSRYWTFRHRERSTIARETVLFFVLNGIGLAITEACLGFTNYALGLKSVVPSNIALFLGIVLGTLFRFWSYRKWVWTAPAAAPAAAVPDPAAVAVDGRERHDLAQPAAGVRSETVPAPPVALSQTGGPFRDEAGRPR